MSFYPSSYTVEHFHADDGNLLSGGTLEYYIAGTTTPVTVYTDSSGTEAGATITLNARGEPEVSGNTIIIWLSASVDYKVIGKNASGGIEWTIDNLTSSSAGNTNTAVAQADYIQWPFITVNGSDTNHDIDFSAGRAADSTATSMLILPSLMTKQIDSAWTAGNNAGGLFSGTVANSTTYYCFLIQKDTDETIDCGFDTSSTAANIPSGYTKYRRIASLATDGSANIDSTSIVPLLSAEVAKRGEANGTCELDADSLVPVARLPASVAYDSDISGLQSQIASNDSDISSINSTLASKEDVKSWVSKWSGSATSVINAWGSGLYIVEVASESFSIEIRNTSKEHGGSAILEGSGDWRNVQYYEISAGNWGFKVQQFTSGVGSAPMNLTAVYKYE